MDYRFSLAGPDDFADVLTVLSWVYSGKAPEPGEELKLPPGRTPMIVRDGQGRPAAACRVHDYQVARGPRTLRTAGIAAVGTLVPHRTRGAGRVLMEGALRAAREEGYAMSALFGFRESYYRGVGYEACGWRWSLEARESCLPRTACDLPLRQGSLAEDLNEVESVFDAFIRRRSGCFLRTEADWKHRIGSSDLGLYLVGDPAEAYCSIRIKGFFQHVEVQEMAWTSREGYDGLWTILRGAAKNQEGVKWFEPPESPFLARYMDHGVKAESAGWCMHRVVNIPEALRQIRPIAGEGSFTIQVQDGLLPENEGPWRVSWRGREAEVERAGEAALVLDVRAASQALMGSPSLAELARHGWVEVRDPSALAAAEAYFGAWSATYMDPF